MSKRKTLLWPVPPSLKTHCPFFLPDHLYMQFVGEEERVLSLMEKLPGRGFGVVGTRDPEVRSKLLVESTIKSLHRSDLAIISGFARGIDYTAHAAAVEAHLPTIAVLASGHNEPYPSHHAELSSRLLDRGGVLVTEYPPGTHAYPSQFLDRNRLIAWLSQALWVVEAGAGSGALNTAHWMRKLERTVFATPCFPGDPAFRGNTQLIEEISPPAVPLFSRRVLETVWLDLVSRNAQAKDQLRLPLSGISADARALLDWVQAEQSTGRGTGLDRTFQSFEEDGWEAARWYMALQELLETRKMIQENGQLLKI